MFCSSGCIFLTNIIAFARGRISYTATITNPIACANTNAFSNSNTDTVYYSNTTSPTPTPIPPRLSLSFVDPDHGWMSIDDSLLMTDDGGQSWRLQQLLPGLQTVQFVTPESGWIATATQLLITTNAGQNWKEVRALEPKDRLVTAVSLEHAWLYTPETFLATSDSGQTWQPWRSACGDPRATPSGPISFITPLIGWETCPLLGIAGLRPNTLHATENGGLTWTTIIDYELGEETPGLPQGGFIYELTMYDAQLGWMVISDRLYADGIHMSRLMKTIDGGISWSALPPGPTGQLRELQFLSAERGYLLAVEGTDYALYRSDDGGQSWHQIWKPTAP